MAVDPWRLGDGCREKSEGADVAGEVVGTKVDEDGGRWGGRFRARREGDAPETASRKIAAERGDRVDAGARPSPRDGLVHPCLDFAAIVHRRRILDARRVPAGG